MEEKQKKEYTPLQTEILTAYTQISKLQVSGDTIDLIAGVRAHLRKAYELTETKEGAEDNG